MSFAVQLAAADQAARVHLGGETVTYAPEDGDPVDVTGIFDEQYLLMQAGGAGVEQAGPAVWLRLSDLPVHPDDDEPTLTIRGVNYRARERRPDGAGGIVLLLHRRGA